MAGLRRPIARWLHRHFIRTWRTPYLPPEYERQWGSLGKSFAYPMLGSLRKWKSKRIFLDELRETDIFLVGHPKSGNTWLAYMLSILLHNDLEEEITLANVGEFAPTVHGKDYEVAYYRQAGNPRIFRTEWPLYPKLYPRVIYLVRDPRSALVSYCHMYRTITGDSDRSMADFVDRYLTETYFEGFEPTIRWDEQVEDWLQARADRRQKVILVRYEDLVSDRRRELTRILEGFDLGCSEGTLRAAVERGDFAAMKKNEERHGAESYQGRASKRGRFIRRGRVDSWRDEMDDGTVRRIETAFARPMKSLGYDRTTKE